MKKSVTPLITVILLMLVCDNTNLISVFPNDNINHAVLSGHFYNFL